MFTTSVSIFRRHRARLGLMLALAVMFAAETAHVNQPQDPVINEFDLLTNDIAAIHGIGEPGTFIQVFMQQRNFIQGDGGSFSFCSWKHGGNPIPVGGIAMVDAEGNWTLDGLDVMVIPSGVGLVCDGGLVTYFEVREVQAGEADPEAAAPELAWMRVRKQNEIGRIEARVRDAYRSSLTVADGPDDEGANVDVDQDGVDICATLGCDSEVTWRCGSGGTFECPAIDIYSGGGLLLPPDPEFARVFGMVQAHRPHGSLLAAGRRNRPEEPDFVVDINVEISGGFEIGTDCGGGGGGGLFDFF